MDDTQHENRIKTHITSEILLTLVKNLPDLVFVKDKTGKFLFVNEAHMKVCGVDKPEDIIGKTDFDFFAEEMARDFFNEDQKTIQAGVVNAGIVEPIADETEGTRWLSTTKIPYRGQNGSIDGVIGFSRDVTFMVEAQKERRRLVSALNQVGDGIIVSDDRGIVEYVNSAFESIIGKDAHKVLGEPCVLIKPPHRQKTEMDREIWNAISGGESWRGEISLPSKEGTETVIDVTVTPVKNEKSEIINYIAIQKDITEKVSLEKRLREAQKMEAIGTLAGGIAHDFNNILMGILGYSDICIRKAGGDPLLTKYLMEIKKAGTRASELVDQILAFSRQKEEGIARLNVIPIVKESVKLLEAASPGSIDIELSYGPELWNIYADASQVHQIFMNLATNAIHAMERDGGVLSFVLENTKLPSGNDLGLTEGRYVLVKVKDTGGGIATEVLEKIFEPYFTTKPQGKGSGMGLSMVHGIVESLGGRIDVESSPEEGSVFSIYLPGIEDEKDSALKTESSVVMGSGKILFIDDEQMLADLGKEMLTDLGYDADVFTDSIEAVNSFKKDPDRYDLLISDMSMPGLSGDKVIAAVRALKPRIPVIVCSGYSEKIENNEIQSLDLIHLLQKPFDIQTLSETLAKVLESARRSG
jgi:PAS domain S-box-containing protein